MTDVADWYAREEAEIDADIARRYAGSRNRSRYPRLRDACQAHDPGDFPATYPHRVTADRGSLRAEYACMVCGGQWACWWDPSAAGWAVPCT